MIAVSKKIIKIQDEFSNNKLRTTVVLEDLVVMEWEKDWPEPYIGKKVVLVIGEDNE